MQRALLLCLYFSELETDRIQLNKVALLYRMYVSLATMDGGGRDLRLVDLKCLLDLQLGCTSLSGGCSIYAESGYVTLLMSICWLFQTISTFALFFAVLTYPSCLRSLEAGMKKPT